MNFKDWMLNIDQELGVMEGQCDYLFCLEPTYPNVDSTFCFKHYEGDDPIMFEFVGTDAEWDRAMGRSSNAE